MDKLKFGIITTTAAAIIASNGNVKAQEFNNSKETVKSQVSQALSLTKEELEKKSGKSLEIEGIDKKIVFTIKNTGKNKEELQKILEDKHASEIVKKYITELLKCGKIIINIPVNKTTALSLDKMGIEMPVDTIIEYNELYNKYINGMKKLVSSAKNEKAKRRKEGYVKESMNLFNSLSIGMKTLTLDIYQAGLKGNLEGNNPEYALARDTTELVAGIYNLNEYTSGGELNLNLPSSASKEATKLREKYPGTSCFLTDEYIASLNDLQYAAIERSNNEIESAEKDLEAEKDRGIKLDKKGEEWDNKIKNLRDLKKKAEALS